jgi:hypothetical protein
MSEALIKVAISLLMKLVTEQFFAKFIIATIDSWAKSSENQWDDKVTKAMADALGVELK